MIRSGSEVCRREHGCMGIQAPCNVTSEPDWRSQMTRDRLMSSATGHPVAPVYAEFVFGPASLRVGDHGFEVCGDGRCESVASGGIGGAVVAVVVIAGGIGIVAVGLSMLADALSGPQA